MKRLLLSLLVLLLLLDACKKTTTFPIGQDGMMRTGKWKISKSMVKLKLPNGKKTTIDYGPYRSACLVDNRLKFDSLNRGSILNGGVSCNIGDADSVGFIWQLKNNGNTIDMLNCYTLIDSVAQTVVLDGTTGNYVVQYNQASSYKSNLYDATISSFSQSSFTLEYDLPAHYADTTAANMGSAAAPVILLDTFHFMITYTNF